MGKSIMPSVKFGSLISTTHPEAELWSRHALHRLRPGKIGKAAQVQVEAMSIGQEPKTSYPHSMI